jgi:DNA-binding NarL/FixJ family response regulator
MSGNRPINAKRISVAVVEDDAGLRQSLRLILDAGSETYCLETFPSAEEACARLPALKPNVVLMDINLPGMNGTACVKQLAPLLPDTHFIMLTVFDDTEAVYQSLAAGAVGYLRKPMEPEQLLEAISDAQKGGAPMTSSIARRVIQVFRTPAADARDAVNETLAPREQEVLSLLSKGFLQKEIADKLNISFPTVRTFTARIYKKLHVHSRSQAVAKYLGAKL